MGHLGPITILRCDWIPMVIQGGQQKPSFATVYWGSDPTYSVPLIFFFQQPLHGKMARPKSPVLSEVIFLS